MTPLRLDAVIAFVESQQRLSVAAHAVTEAIIVRRDADAALRDAWAELTAEEQRAVNAVYAPGGVEVTAA